MDIITTIWNAIRKIADVEVVRLLDTITMSEVLTVKDEGPDKGKVVFKHYDPTPSSGKLRLYVICIIYITFLR